MSWVGFTTSAAFQEAALHALALGTQHHVQGWLSDDRQLGALRPRDLEWVQEAAMTRLAAIGVARFAHLESEDALNRRIIDQMYQQVIPQVTYQVRRFTDLVAARAWAAGLVD